MQETMNNEMQTLQEFYTGKTNEDIKELMDNRLEVLKGKGHTLIRRIQIGRNDRCPCNSGKKFKKCCIDKIKENEYETRRN